MKEIFLLLSNLLYSKSVAKILLLVFFIIEENSPEPEPKSSIIFFFLGKCFLTFK